MDLWADCADISYLRPQLVPHDNRCGENDEGLSEGFEGVLPLLLDHHADQARCAELKSMLAPLWVEAQSFCTQFVLFTPSAPPILQYSYPA
jgi:hypothetical protein